MIAKAHNVAVYRKIDAPEFVKAMLRYNVRHELSSLEEIDNHGKYWSQSNAV